VFRTGRRFDGAWLQLVAAPAAQCPGQVGYVLGRRVMPRAVDRNRLRRRLRVIVGAARPGIARFDIILRVRAATPRASIVVAAEEASALIQRALADTP
jgi:ribonuclease P protein component